MAVFLRNNFMKIVLMIVTISIVLTFVVTPSAYAKLDIEDGEFYYSGTTKGTYTVTEGIFSWLLTAIGDIVDWLVGIMTMGIRMVFVGWTALVERLLTWALQSTTGVNLDGELVDNSTDIMQILSSSDNVTVEAIVFNQVPALNINFFKQDIDTEVSGTGQRYICECGKESHECVQADGKCSCGCGSNGKPCTQCSNYIAGLKSINDKTSVILMLRTELSKWYQFMRFLAYAAMLVILIAIGIKMLITNIASEKALYKRMFVDWVVGIIIITGIHYVMWSVININEILVDVVHERSIAINEKKLANLNLMTLADKPSENKDGYNNQQLEIKVYEEIRTRAYDPKLTVGLPGMIMYMTLVYFAVRYTVVYLKRYLTIMVLALMGPGLGVAYAIQKVFHGKSPAYSKWLKEFVMNVIIQVVHAIMYAVFVTEALVLALDSLAGMFIALVFLNYTLIC